MTTTALRAGYTPEAEAFRAEVRATIARHLPADWRGLGALDRDAVGAFSWHWREVLRDEGLLALSWPVRYRWRRSECSRAGGAGRGVRPRRRADRAPQDNFGIKMVGEHVAALGHRGAEAAVPPAILSGDDRWCQGYSEPDAGSDLASLSTRADRDGDEWVIDGQKIWTSLAADATWIFVLARTDPDARRAPRHLVPPVPDSTSPASRCGPSRCSTTSASSARCTSPARVRPPTMSWARSVTVGRWR